MSIRVLSSRTRSVRHQRSNTNHPRPASRARGAAAAAALAGTAALALAGTSAHAQMVYEPFDYGSNATVGSVTAPFPNQYANTTGTTAFQGYENPTNGQSWFSASNGLANDDKIFPTQTIAQISGFAAFTGTDAGNDARNTGTKAPRLGIGPVPFSTAGDQMYYSMAFQVTNLTGMSATANIFAAFNNSTGTQSPSPTVLGTRMMVRLDPSDATKYNIGIRPGADAIAINWAPDAGSASTFKQFSTSDNVLVVGGYKFVAGTGGVSGQDDIQQLWINPDPSTFGAGTAPAPTITAVTSATNGDIASVNSFLLRTATAGSPTGVRYDEIRLDQTWAQVTPPTGSGFTGASSTDWGNAGTWDAGGVPDGAAKFAYLRGAGGTVNVEANHSIGTLTLRSSSPYTVAGTGGTLTFDAGTGGTSAINAQPANNGTTSTPIAASHTISAPVSLANNLVVHAGVSQTVTLSGGVTGTGNIVKDSPGTLVLSGNVNQTGSVSSSNGILSLRGTNGFSGTVTATGGTLEIDGDAALGAVPGAPTANLFLAKPSAGLTFKFLAPTTLNANRTITISQTGGGNGPTFDTNGSDVTVNGQIVNSGVVNLIKAGGSGTLFLRNTNTFGSLFINAGTVNVDAADRLGTAGTQLNTGLGTLQFANSFAWGARALTFGGSGGGIDTNGVDQLIDGTLAGSGLFTKLGAGNLTITGVSTRTGGTAVSNGTLTAKTSLGIGDVTVLAGATTTSAVIDTSLAAVNAIGDQAAVSLAATAGNGIMNLGAGVNDTVGGLVINGIAQTQNGTYGATGSGATFIDDTAFTGTGVLNLQLGRTLHWDLNGTTAGVGTANPAAPSGNWGAPGVITFNTDSTGAAAGMLTGTSIATDPVVFTAGSDGTGTYTVTVVGAQKAASVTVARGNLTLGGTGSIATPTISVASGATASVSAGLVSTTGISKTGTGTLTVSSANTYTGGTTVSAGTLVLANADATSGGAINVADGAIAQAQAALPKAVTVTTLNTNTTGKFDLTNNSMVVKGMTDTAVKAEIVKAYNAGAWNGTGGLTSSTAAAATIGTTGIGYALNSDLGTLTEFKGVTPLSATDVLVRYTYFGDADLDGDVDGNDVGNWAGNFTGSGGSTTKTWFQGDWDYDGDVDGNDVGLWAGNFTGSGGGILNLPNAQPGAIAALEAMGFTVVPEPASLALLGLAGAGLLGRRRRGD